MNSVTIYLKDLKAVAYAMAVKNVRYYLNGVCIETTDTENRLIASDGHRFHIVIDREHHDVDNEHAGFIIPGTIVNKILKSKVSKHIRAPEIALTFTDGFVNATMPDGSVFIEPLIDGKFPDYRRIIPNELGEVVPAHYQYKYLIDAYAGLSDYREYSKTYTHQQPLYQRGNDVGLLINDCYMAAIMPVRAAGYIDDVAIFKK